MTEEPTNSRFGDKRFASYPEWWAMTEILTGTQLKVLLAFNVHADFETGENCWISKETIAQSLGLSVRTVRSNSRILEALGLLVPRQRRKGGATVYAIDRVMTQEQARARLLELNEVQAEGPENLRTPEMSIRGSEDFLPERHTESLTPETDFRGIGNALPAHPGNWLPGTPEMGFRQPHSLPETIEPETIPETRALSRAPCSPMNGSFSKCEIAHQVEIETNLLPKRHRSEYRAMAGHFYEAVGQLPPRHRVKATEALRGLLVEEPVNWRALKGFLQGVIKASHRGGQKEILRVLKGRGCASCSAATPTAPVLSTHKHIETFLEAKEAQSSSKYGANAS